MSRPNKELTVVLTSPMKLKDTIISPILEFYPKPRVLEIEGGPLVVGLSLQPSSMRLVTQDVFTALIVDEDEQREWKGWQPPVELQGVHTQALVHARSVA